MHDTRAGQVQRETDKASKKILMPRTSCDCTEFHLPHHGGYSNIDLNDEGKQETMNLFLRSTQPRWFTHSSKSIRLILLSFGGGWGFVGVLLDG
jgi:hypothetical protein